MDRYTLTIEGRAKLRRTETRANIEASADTDDFKLLHYLYVHGPATIEEIESFSRLPWDEVVNKISTLMSRGYIEGFTERQQF
jgi:DNA-binding Lrp family transcriptional regulator